LNVICIIADSWRVDYLGCYGNSWIKTPNIDRLAEESAVFTRAYSEYPFTPPTREAWHTGRYTFPFGIGSNPTSNVLGNVLQRYGFNTACIWDFPSGSPYWRGFDLMLRSEQWRTAKTRWLSEDIEVDIDRYYKDYPNRSGLTQGTDRQKRRILAAHLRERLTWRGDEDSYVARVVKHGIRWLESQEGNDHVFLWLDSWDPHEPWDPPSPYDRMYTDPNYKGKDIIWPNEGPIEGYLSEEEINHIKALYAGKITMVDKWIGILIDRIKELGFWDNSLIIFTSDHGEPFGEHGYIRKYMTTPHEYLSHIPLIIRHPDGFGKGKRFNCFVDTTDLMPTILDFYGILRSEGSLRYLPSPLIMHGSSLLPIIKGEREKIRYYSYSGGAGRYPSARGGLVEECWSIRDDVWRYILWLPKHFLTPSGGYQMQIRKPELYNLVEDPGEQVNLVEEHPDVARDLELELRRFVSSLPPPPTRNQPVKQGMFNLRL